jgi:hypothetical protein
MVGYDELEISAHCKVSVEEIQADLAYIRSLLPEETVALNIGERNEILEAKVRSKKMREELAADMSLSAKELIRAGKNPIGILRKYREAVTAEDPSSLIPELRQENIRTSVKENTDDLTPKQQKQFIAELRERDRKPAKTIMSENPARYEYPCDPTEQNAHATDDQEQKPRDSRTDRRITVRLDPALYDKIRQYCQDAGVELSMAVRRALRDFLEDDALSMVANSNEMPQEALSLTGRYQTRGSDLREELWMQFLRAIAAAHTTSRRWHRDERSRRLYEGLIRLYHSLEVEDVRQI